MRANGVAILSIVIWTLRADDPHDCRHFDEGKMHKNETYPDRAKVLNWSACKLHPSIVVVKTQTLLAANTEPGSEAERRRRFAAKLAVLELHSKGLRMAWGLSV